MLRLIETVLRCLPRPPRQRPRRCHRPVLEFLEQRCTPNNQTFTWAAGAPGNWENQLNWRGGVVGDAYPDADGSGTDIVQFSGLLDPNCQMTAAHTVAQLIFSGTGELLTLGAPLTLNNPGSGASCGSLDGGSEILQTTNNQTYQLTIAAGTFAWKSGNINYDSNTVQKLGTLTIDSSGELDVAATASGVQPNLGDSINNYGTLALDNTVPVTLAIAALTITNEAGTEPGVITVDVANAKGLILGSGINPVAIQNNGLFDKTTASGGLYAIADPVNNTRTLEIDSGTLEFQDGIGSPAYTVTQSAWGATIDLALGGTTLKADQAGVSITGGTLKDPGGSATVAGNLLANGGKVFLQVGNASTQALGQLTITGNFTFDAGKFTFSVDMQGGSYSTLTAQGSTGIQITKASTLAAVGGFNLGNGNNGPKDMYVFTAQNGTINNPVGSVSGPPGFTYTAKIVGNQMEVQRVTPQVPASPVSNAGGRSPLASVAGPPSVIGRAWLAAGAPAGILKSDDMEIPPTVGLLSPYDGVVQALVGALSQRRSRADLLSWYPWIPGGW